MKITIITGTILLVCFQLFADPVIVAHRGASRDAPENTIPAFKLAWEQSADAIEGDFHLTKDRQIVCIHDNDTKRVAGKKLIVKDSSLEQLRKLDVGAWRGKQWEYTRIPTISEVFATVPNGKKFYVEIKCGVEIIPKLLDEIRSSKLKIEQIVIISFNTKVLREVKKQAPQFKTLWLSGFEKKKSGKVTPSLETVLKTLKQIHADGFSSTYKTISESFVRRILKEGYEYHVWTVDDLKTARRFKKWGDKSITTNVPHYIKKNLYKPRR